MQQCTESASILASTSKALPLTIFTLNESTRFVHLVVLDRLVSRV